MKNLFLFIPLIISLISCNGDILTDIEKETIEEINNSYRCETVTGKGINVTGNSSYTELTIILSEEIEQVEFAASKIAIKFNSRKHSNDEDLPDTTTILMDCSKFKEGAIFEFSYAKNDLIQLINSNEYIETIISLFQAREYTLVSNHFITLTDNEKKEFVEVMNNMDEKYGEIQEMSFFGWKPILENDSLFALALNFYVKRESLEQLIGFSISTQNIDPDKRLMEIQFN